MNLLQTASENNNYYLPTNKHKLIEIINSLNIDSLQEKM
jgi:hypothetical protein